VSSFEYLRPESLSELLHLLREHGTRARVLAGGTDLVVRIKKGLELPPVVVDLKRVAELRADVIEADGDVRIGARAVMTDVIEHQSIRRYFPAIADAARVVGSVQIRNRATLAGNVCNASPAADTAPALLAYGAYVTLRSADGPRRIPLDNFFTGPGRTTLATGEIIESIDLPLPVEHTGAAFVRLTRRHGVDLAIVSVCCVIRESGDVRFAFGAVGPRPFVVTGRNDSSLDEVVAHASPISDLRASDEYRIAMLPVLARRAFKTASERLQHSRGRS
jgi:carbon-monoxide dehydrogenase medium subunit